MEGEFSVQISGSDNTEKIPEILPIVPLRGIVLYPGVLLPLAIARKKSIDAVNKALISDKLVGFLAQENPSVEEPTKKDLYKVGCVGNVLKMLKFPDGTQRVLIQGIKRFKATQITENDKYFEAKVKILKNKNVEKEVELEALTRSLISYFRKFVSLIPDFPEEILSLILEIKSPDKLADMVSVHVNLDLKQRQELLETVSVPDKLIKIIGWLTQELQVLELGSKIQEDVETELGKSQREFLLREQLRAIRKELGEENDISAEHEELKKQILETQMPKIAEEYALRELKNLSRMHQSSAEYSVARNYLDWMISLPWNKETSDDWSLLEAEKQLEKDHYGLEEVKERIIEFLAIRKLKKDMKGPILCLIGPPGVGKTSVGKSIALALGRKFARISLGGVHDEAEIRGHRRTYVGALPGRILQNLRKVEVRNPVIMLDEIDKLGRDHRGDPSSALLEVLDPEQNNTFADHYLDTEFDLSKILFIATANVVDTIPGPLRDRMEIINISGYTLEEKVKIAQDYLIPKEKEATGLSKRKIILEEEAIQKIISDYTREAGVRQLSAKINSVFRKIGRLVAEGKRSPRNIKAKKIEDMFGSPKFFNEIAERTNLPGVVTGLAWTAVGGDVLFIEANKMAGKGKLTLTGQLGNVMQESAQAALSFLKANAKALKIETDFFSQNDIHIHFPAGAVPKDGPSAGITIATALYSLVKEEVVPANLAMTGEITIKGKVLPVGGIKEKVLAAKRAGISKVILPFRNKAELYEVKKEYLADLDFIFAKNINQVFSDIKKLKS